MRNLVKYLVLLFGLSYSLAENKEWDFLIFVQRWPETACFEWEESNPHHTCTMPDQDKLWTIHGIWPTRNGTMGPFFCDPDRTFNYDQVRSISDDLKELWPNIENGTAFDSLWKHEWEKHGTCAAVLNDLGDELKYFSKGLAWRQKFAMANLLAQANILPNQSRYAGEFHDAIYQVIGKNPIIQCYYDHKTKTQYLQEIRICFDKQLELRDCDGAIGDTYKSFYSQGTLITNCHPAPVVYPSQIPTQTSEEHEDSFYQHLFINLYNLVTFLRWYTF